MMRWCNVQTNEYDLQDDTYPIICTHHKLIINPWYCLSISRACYNWTWLWILKLEVVPKNVPWVLSSRFHLMIGWIGKTGLVSESDRCFNSCLFSREWFVAVLAFHCQITWMTCSCVRPKSCHVVLVTEFEGIIRCFQMMEFFKWTPMRKRKCRQWRHSWWMKMLLMMKW